MKSYASLFALVVSLCVSPARAELLLGVTVFRELISFDSAAPGSILTTQPITGLIGQDQFESIQGIDFRPATGQLYAIGNAPGSIYRIYTIQPQTGVATQVGADLNLTGVTSLGFDFNPVADRIRIVTDNDINIRIHPDTGALVATDTVLSFAVADPNAASNPNVVGAAYTNNVANSLSTTLYDIDSNLNILTTQIPPNNGSLNTVGPLGVDVSSAVGFDVSGLTGTAFLSSADFSGRSDLYTVNLATGAASLLGEIGTGLIVNDITTSVAAVPEPTSFGLLATAVLLGVAHRRRQRR